MNRNLVIVFLSSIVLKSIVRSQNLGYQEVYKDKLDRDSIHRWALAIPSLLYPRRWSIVADAGWY